MVVTIAVLTAVNIVFTYAMVRDIGVKWAIVAWVIGLSISSLILSLVALVSA